MSPVQCKMARAAVGWSVVRLSQLAGVNKNTVVNFENGKDAYASTANKLHDAFLQTGLIRFEGENAVYYLGELVAGSK